MPAVLCPVLGYPVQERKFGARAVKMEYFILRKDEEAGAVQSGEGEAQGSHRSYFMGRSKGEGARFSSAVPTGRTRDDGHKTHEIPSDHKKIIILP